MELQEKEEKEQRKQEKLFRKNIKNGVSVVELNACLIAWGN